MTYTTVCPLCGISYQLTGIHGYGICTRETGRYEAVPLTEADIRRIVREELERAALAAQEKP